MKNEFTLQDAERLFKRAKEYKTESGLKHYLRKYTLKDLQAPCTLLNIFPIGTRNMCVTAIKSSIGRRYPEQKMRWSNKMYRRVEKERKAKNAEKTT